MAYRHCGAFLGLTQIVLPNLLQQAGPYAEKLAADYVNGTVQLGPVTWPGSNTILVKDIVVRDQKQQTIVSVPEVRISINPFKGFSGLEKAVSEINLERPTVYIKQDKDENLSAYIFDLVKSAQKSDGIFGTQIAIFEKAGARIGK